MSYIEEMIKLRRQEALVYLHNAISRCKQETFDLVGLTSQIELAVKSVYGQDIWIEILTDKEKPTNE